MHLCLVAVLVLDGTQLYQHGKIGQEEFLLGFGGMVMNLCGGRVWLEMKNVGMSKDECSLCSMQLSNISMVTEHRASLATASKG